MKHQSRRSSRRSKKRRSSKHLEQNRRRSTGSFRPTATYRQRALGGSDQSAAFYAQEVWHEPTGRRKTKFVMQSAGEGYVHPITIDDVRKRLELLPARFANGLEVVQFSRMTRKRALFPCYGMQWGPNVYLYPIEESLVETYVRPPKPQQLIEARMYGGRWSQDGDVWRLSWTAGTIKDFYLNNVLIHEVGHLNDSRNTNFDERERYANWFAIEYGYRASRRS